MSWKPNRACMPGRTILTSSMAALVSSGSDSRSRSSLIFGPRARSRLAVEVVRSGVLVDDRNESPEYHTLAIKRHAFGHHFHAGIGSHLLNGRVAQLL